LAETYRILGSGGIFRVVVPDLNWRAKEYVIQAGAGVSEAADIFMMSTLLGKERKFLSALEKLRGLLGHSTHLWMFDESSLRRRLDLAGFTSIRRCEFGDSKDPAFSQVERLDRFWQQGKQELALEAFKPL
jgi:hypothetical protein